MVIALWAFESGRRGPPALRNDKDFSAKYPAITKALAAIPDETPIDEEIAAMEAGRSSFKALQNYGSSTGALNYYMFDVMVVAGKDVMALPLEAHRDLLRRRVPADLGTLLYHHNGAVLA